MKVCSKCGENKELDQFNNELKRLDGKYPWCKECLAEHRKSRYSKVPRKVWIEQKVCSKCKKWKNREEFRLYPGKNLHYRCIECEDNDKLLDDQGLTECSTCGEVKSLNDFYKSRTDKTSKQCIECHKNYSKQPDVKLRAREGSLLKKFGITLDVYKDLLEKQNHKCPICLLDFEKDKYSYPVDHAHSGPNAGAIRAILHDRCNRFVMWKHTDPEQLRRAADLIENPLTDLFVPEEYLHGTPKKRKPRGERKLRNSRSARAAFGHRD